MSYWNPIRRFSSSLPFVVTLGLTFLAGCSDDDPTQPNDAGHDSAMDAGVDASELDLGRDIGNEPPDAGDAGRDLGTDASTDAGDGGMAFTDPLEGGWSEDFAVPGTVGEPGAFVATIAGSGSLTYIGGKFSSVSGIPADNVAMWDGTTWHDLSGGVDQTVQALAVDPSSQALYAAGSSGGGIGIGSPGAIEIYDGSSWSDFAALDGAFPEVHDLTFVAGNLVAAGAFEGIDGSNSANLASYDGNQWNGWGSAPNGDVRVVALDEEDRPCIGGSFTEIGTTNANRVACWDATAGDWAPLGDGLSGEVYDLEPDGPGGALIAAGSFAFFDSVTSEVRAGLARWDGTEWTPFQGGVQDGDINIVRTLERNPNGDLVIGGQFGTVDKHGTNVAANNIARWDGTAWNTIGDITAGVGVFAPGVAGVYDLHNSANTLLYAGGLFSRAGQATALGIASYDAPDWASVVPQGDRSYDGVNGLVNALFETSDGVVAGGDFSVAGSSLARSVATWDGSEWSAVGAGLDGAAFTAAVDPQTGDIWLGGPFSISLGPTRIDFLARWDAAESKWESVGTASPDGRVKSIEFTDDGALVAGDFVNIGGVEANRVARWDGNQWSALGEGLGATSSRSATVSSIVEGPSGDVWATGIFQTTGAGEPAAYLARFDGTSWSQVGDGLSGRGADLQWHQGDLHIAGTFETAGGVEVNSVARWNGVDFVPLGAGLKAFGTASTVTALAPYGPGLFATGTFGSDGTGPRHIAWWDGAEWHPLGEGLNDLAETIIVVDDSLWAGGSFTTAGGVPSVGVARWAW